MCPNASNARQGIKTHFPPPGRTQNALGPNASNARQGIKTYSPHPGTTWGTISSERLQCPTGH